MNLTQYPAAISSVYSPIYFVFYDSHSGDTDFKYIVQLKTIDGTIAEKKIFASPDGYGRIDVSPILKSYFGYNLNYSSTGITSGSTLPVIKEFDLYVGYVTSTTSQAPASTGTFMAFPGVDINTPDFIYSGGSTQNKFLTNSPRNVNIYLNDYYTLSTFNGNFPNSYANLYSIIYIYVYNNNGNKVYRMSNPNYNYSPGGPLLNIDPMLQTIGVGPRNLNSNISIIDNGTSSVATQPIIHSGTTRYSVLMNVNSSDYFWFNVNQNAGRYAQDQIAFLNRHGNFSYFTFTGKTLKNTKKEISSYLKNNYTSTPGTFTTNNQNRGTTIYNTNYITEYVFQSDWIDQLTMDFMEELFTSPEVYYITTTGAIPLIITDTSWSNKRKINDKVINFTITCQEANKKRTNI